MSKIGRRCVFLIVLLLLLFIGIVLMIILCPLQRQLPKAPQREVTTTPQKQVTKALERQLATTTQRQLSELTTTPERQLTKAHERQPTTTPQIQLTTTCSPKFKLMNRVVDAFANILMPVDASLSCRWWCLRHTNCTGFIRFLNNDTCHYSTNHSEALSNTTSPIIYHRVTNRCPIV